MKTIHKTNPKRNLKTIGCVHFVRLAVLTVSVIAVSTGLTGCVSIGLSFPLSPFTNIGVGLNGHTGQLAGSVSTQVGVALLTASTY
jgi:hypothetical protein